MRSRTCIACVTAAAFLTCAARADIVYLKNGNAIKGRVISEGGGVLVVEMHGGVVRLRSSEVLYVKRETVPENFVTHLRGLVRAGRTADAARQLTEVSDVLPGGEVRDLRVEILQAEAGRLEKALRLAEAHQLLVEAKGLAPDDAGIAEAAGRLARELENLRDLVKRARLSAEGGELGEAAELFEKALAVAPESRALIGAELADVYERLGDEALSRSDAASANWYQKAVGTEPSRAEALRERHVHARLIPILKHLGEGEFGEARRGLDGLVDYAPSDPQARYVYGRLFETKRNWTGARGQYLAALPEEERPAAPPATRRGVASLRERVERQLRAIHDEALSKKRLREERARVEPGRARRLAGRYFVVHHRNEKLAREVLAAAERQVEELLRAAGAGPSRLKALWKVPCPIHLLRDEESFLLATGQPQWSGGVSHTEAVNGKLSRQYLSVYQTAPRLLMTTIPHEVTHLVFSALTGYSGGVPLAVHEGLAVSREPGFRKRRDLGMLAWKRLAGGLIPLLKLFEMKDAGVDPTLFYAESASVVSLLVEKKGLRTLLRFSTDVARHGVEKALSLRYGTDVEGLEREWTESLGG